MIAPRSLAHPGPRNPARFAALPCRATPVTLRIAAGLPFDRAVTDAFARAGFTAGYLRLVGAHFRRLSYVVPGPAPGDGRAAWYRAAPPLHDARVQDAGLHLGNRAGAAFQHCHGLWSADGALHMGHMLLPDSALAEDLLAEGWGLRGAGLSVMPDPETGFDLFAPQAAGDADGADAVLCTLRPNEDPHALLARIAQGAGMSEARIEGIGSLVDTRFTGARLDSYATEILVRAGRLAGGRVCLDVASVGFDGRPCCGVLMAGENRICITAEILLIGG
ncbi:hypothetical protein [Pontitalea aquivivens]|uniref:hypothetical protein n=1 Tax=Pontitalea aquivivens TaxID=3388663 RepID=UPI003970F57D